MANKYWLGFLPESTMTSAQAMSVVTLGRNMATSTVGKILAAFANATTSTATASQLGAIASTNPGYIEVSTVKFTSGQADPEYVLDVDISAIEGVIGSTDRSTALAGAALTDYGILKVKMKSTAGGTVDRYIKLWST